MKLWIRLDAALPRDPAVRDLAVRLGIRKAEAIGLLACVWFAIAEHRASGDVSDVSATTLEDWAEYEPKGRGKRGTFASAFTDLFTRDGMVRGWKDRQGKLIERMEKDRRRKQQGDGNSTELMDSSQNISSEIPRSFHGNSAPTERNGTEQDGTEELTTNFNIARGALASRMPEEYRGDLEAFLRSLGSVTRQFAWIRNLDAKLTGMHPPIATPEALGAALRQLAANGEHPNWKRFEGYIRRMTEAPHDPKQSPRGGNGDAKGQGMLIVGDLRSRRTHHATGHASGYAIAQSDVDALDPAAKKALVAIGGASKVANHPDDTFSFLASQFAAMYQAALTNASQETAA